MPVCPAYRPATQGGAGRRAGVQDAATAAEEFAGFVDGYLGPGADLGAAMRDMTAAVEKRVLRHAVDSGMNQRALADVLGMSRMTLRKKLRKHGLAMRT